MEITIKLNTNETHDAEMISILGLVLGETSHKLYSDKEEESEQAASVENCQRERTVAAEDVKEEPVEEKPKPKRSRKKKEEEPSQEPEAAAKEPDPVEPPTQEEVNAAMEKENDDTSAEVPETPVVAVVGPAKLVNSMTQEEWRKHLVAKQIEVGLVARDGSGELVEGERASYKPRFNDFVHRISEDYGNRIPSKLHPEALYSFVEQFDRIVWNDSTKGFEIGSCPF